MVDRKTGDGSEDVNVSSLRGDQDTSSGACGFESLESGIEALAKGAWATGYAAGYLDAQSGAVKRSVAHPHGGFATIKSGAAITAYPTFHITWDLHGVQTR